MPTHRSHSAGSGYGQFSNPNSLAIHDGIIYVADRDNNRIQLFDLEGVFQSAFGAKGSGYG